MSYSLSVTVRHLSFTVLKLVSELDVTISCFPFPRSAQQTNKPVDSVSRVSILYAKDRLAVAIRGSSQLVTFHLSDAYLMPHLSLQCVSSTTSFQDKLTNPLLNCTAKKANSLK